MKALEKYNDHRHNIRHGDIILYHGNGFLAKAIQWTDKCYYNHVGLVIKYGDRLFTVDMWYDGILNGKLVIVPLSERMLDYKDFCIIRPLYYDVKVNNAIDNALNYLDFGVSYDRLKLVKVLLKKKLGITVNIDKERKFICSEFVQKYVNYFSDRFRYIKDITPADFIRFIDNNYKIMLHDNQHLL